MPIPDTAKSPIIVSREASTRYFQAMSTVRENLAEYRLFLVAICKQTAIYLTGGVLVATFTVCSALGKTLPAPWVWSLVALAFVVTAFRAWRDQYRAVRAAKRFQRREDVLKKTTDIIRQEKQRLEKTHVTLSPTIHALPALLKAGGDELESEEDLVWVCGEMERHRFAHPFNAFSGTAHTLLRQDEWLPFLKKLRIARGAEVGLTAPIDFWHKGWKD